MFHEPLFVANSLNVIFPRAQQIRRGINAFEDRLSGQYGQPQAIPVPDELDPQFPRLIFQSVGGHSQLLISQVSITLNVNYDGEWTRDSSKRLAYLQERAPLVYDLCGLAEVQPAFTGLTGRARLPSDASSIDILARLASVLGVKNGPADLSEMSLRLSSVVDTRFFDNITVQSYQEWMTDDAIPVRRLRAARANSRGVEFIHDFNDRYAYNEQDAYFTSQTTGLEIATRAQHSLDAWVSRLKEGGLS